MDNQSITDLSSDKWNDGNSSTEDDVDAGFREFEKIKLERRAMVQLG